MHNLHVFHLVQQMNSVIDRTFAITKEVEAVFHGFFVLEHDIDIIPASQALHDIRERLVIEIEEALLPVDVAIDINIGMRQVAIGINCHLITGLQRSLTPILLILEPDGTFNKRHTRRLAAIGVDIKLCTCDTKLHLIGFHIERMSWVLGGSS